MVAMTRPCADSVGPMAKRIDGSACMIDRGIITKKAAKKSGSTIAALGIDPLRRNPGKLSRRRGGSTGKLANASSNISF